MLLYAISVCSNYLPPMFKKRSLFKKLGMLLIILGLLVLLYVPATWLWGYIEQRGLRGDFERESAAAISMNQTVLDKLHGAAELEKLKQLALAHKVNLRSEQTIALLEIPKIGVNVIVVEGTGDGSLRKGPGHLEETPLPGMGGNFAVAGDRVLYGGPFLNLDELAAGDEIFLKTSYGRFNYTVADSHLTTPEDVSILNSSGSEVITLITCDPPWDTSRRLVVQGKLVSALLLEESDSPAPSV